MRFFKLASPVARQNAKDAVDAAPDGYIVRISEETRSLDQNAKLWPLLHDVSDQVEWYGNRLTDEEWKDVFTAALKGQKTVPGINGGFVVCGQSTSRMGKRMFSDLIELIYAFGAEQDVRWSE